MHLSRLLVVIALLAVTSTTGPDRVDAALERQGSRRLDDVDAAAGARFGRARADEGRDGKYTEPIGSGRDPLKVFTVRRDVDGRPAIRISGEVFGELQNERNVHGLSPEVAVQVGRKEMAAARPARTARDSGLLYHVHAAPGAGRTDLGAFDRAANPGA